MRPTPRGQRRHDAKGHTNQRTQPYNEPGYVPPRAITLREFLEEARKCVDIMMQIDQRPREFASDTEFRLRHLRAMHDILRKTEIQLHGVLHGVENECSRAGVAISNDAQGVSQPSLQQAVLNLAKLALPNFISQNRKLGNKHAALKQLQHALERELQSLGREIRHLERVVEGRHHRRRGEGHGSRHGGSGSSDGGPSGGHGGGGGGGDDRGGQGARRPPGRERSRSESGRAPPRSDGGSRSGSTRGPVSRGARPPSLARQSLESIRPEDSVSAVGYSGSSIQHSRRGRSSSINPPHPQHSSQHRPNQRSSQEQTGRDRSRAPRSHDAHLRAHSRSRSGSRAPANNSSLYAPPSELPHRSRQHPTQQQPGRDRSTTRAPVGNPPAAPGSRAGSRAHTDRGSAHGAPRRHSPRRRQGSSQEQHGRDLSMARPRSDRGSRAGSSSHGQHGTASQGPSIRRVSAARRPQLVHPAEIIEIESEVASLVNSSGAATPRSRSESSERASSVGRGRRRG